MKQITDDFDRLGIARTGITFAAILSEVMDKGFELREDVQNQANPS